MSVLTEEECFLKAVCDEPRCKTTRLVYADWLDDRGEKPWLTEEIRKGYATVAVDAWCAVEPGVWRGVHDRKAVPRNTGTWIDRALTPFDGLMTSAGSPYVAGTLMFRGGFLDSATLDVHRFFDNAALFGRHPARNIWLSDLRPRATRYLPGSGVASQWIVYVHNVHLTHERVQPSTECTYLPPQFKALLKGDVYEAAYGDREYRTEKEARDDVAQACAAYAKKYYGWSRHGERAASPAG